MLPLAAVALVSAPPAPQTRSVGRSEATEACSVHSEAWWRTLEPLALFAALQPQEPLFMGSKRVAELRSLGDVESAAKAGKPTVIMFYAPWCPHCRNTKPVLDKVAERLVNIEFKQIDASGNAEVRGPYGVTAYPTIKYFDAANLEGLKYNWHGADEDDLRGFLERAMVTASSIYQAVALTVAPTADGAQGWIFDERSFPLERGPWACAPTTRNADYDECLEAVQQAAASKGGLQVKGLKKMNSGERKRVPRGCSYSVEAEMAIYNKNPNGTSTHGRMYQLACIALSHETLKAAHEEQADSNKAHKASKASKEAAHRANKASRHSAKGARVGGAPEVGGETQSDPTGEGGVVEYDIPGEYDPHDEEGGPCPTDPVPPCPPDHGGPGQEPCPHSSHPDVGCHMPGNAPQCNEVHKAHPDHDPALPDCDTMAGSGDPWAASPPPSARTLGLSE
jgi:thiol-disulfide isomerase/thioredoxin